MRARKEGGVGRQKSDGQALQPVEMADSPERRVPSPMALQALDPGGRSRPFRGVGPGLEGACCCPAGGGRGRSLARSLAHWGALRPSAGKSVATVGRRAKATLCRGRSPDGPAGPGVTGCRRGAPSPGYSAARAEAAAPPSGPEEPALPGARTAFSPAPPPTDLTRPGPTRPDRAQREQVGVPPCPAPSRGLRNYSPHQAPRRRAPGVEGSQVPGICSSPGQAGVPLGPGPEAGAARPTLGRPGDQRTGPSGPWGLSLRPKKLRPLQRGIRACGFPLLLARKPLVEQGGTPPPGDRGASAPGVLPPNRVRVLTLDECRGGGGLRESCSFAGSQ